MAARAAQPQEPVLQAAARQVRLELLPHIPRQQSVLRRTRRNEGRVVLIESLSSEDLRAFQDEIFAGDRPILESQSPKRLPVSGGEVHVATDLGSSAYRRYLRERGITFGVC